MKKIVITATLLALAASVATPAMAKSNGGNGCGVGSPPRADFTVEQKKRWAPPFFIRQDNGRNGYQKNAHNACVADRGNK